MAERQTNGELIEGLGVLLRFAVDEDEISVLSDTMQRLRSMPEGTLYVCRCGYCGEAEGTVDPDEVCSASTPDEMYPHHFGVFERIIQHKGQER